MKRILASVLVALAASLAVAAQTPREQAREEINAGAEQYRAGNYVEAQRHFERALELDASNWYVYVFLARALHQQYRPGDTSPENVAVAERAVAAYQRALAHSPDHEDSFKAVAYLFRLMGDEAREREWLLRRAESDSAPSEKRAEAYVVLASLRWKCSYDITERKENKETFMQDAATPVLRYLRPKDEAEFERARVCAAEGLKLAERAAELAPELATAWAYKTNLLREMAKLAQMEGDPERKGAFFREADEAEATYRRLMEGRPRTEAVNRSVLTSPDGRPVPPPPTDNAGPGDKQRIVVQGGVLNGKAVSKPAPEYPAEARAARVQGTVTVQVVVDEEGRVTEATPVSGDPMLRTAAAVAARQARFSPTRLRGQPVKIVGVITYNFVLQ